MAPTNRKEFSHDLREVVIKRYLNGDSERDIARDLLISRNTVHYSRVQKFLSSMFQMFIKVDIMNIETIYTEY